MGTTKKDISGWFDVGVTGKEDYMVVVCDTFDHEDYPIYCKKYDFWDRYHEHDGVNMQRIMEVYDLHMDKDTQLNEHRSNHCPPY